MSEDWLKAIRGIDTDWTARYMGYPLSRHMHNTDKANFLNNRPHLIGEAAIAFSKVVARVVPTAGYIQDLDEAIFSLRDYFQQRLLNDRLNVESSESSPPRQHMVILQQILEDEAKKSHTKLLPQQLDDLFEKIHASIDASYQETSDLIAQQAKANPKIRFIN